MPLPKFNPNGTCRTHDYSSTNCKWACSEGSMTTLKLRYDEFVDTFWLCLVGERKKVTKKYWENEWYKIASLALKNYHLYFLVDFNEHYFFTSKIIYYIFINISLHPTSIPRQRMCPTFLLTTTKSSRQGCSTERVHPFSILHLHIPLAIVWLDQSTPWFVFTARSHNLSFAIFYLGVCTLELAHALSLFTLQIAIYSH